jgi:hypothetical protein
VTTVTPELAAQIEAATAALPAAYRLPLQNQEIIEKDLAFEQLQNWAFTKGFALAVESGRADRVVYQYVYYKKKT